LQPSYELKTDPRPDLPQGPGGKPDGSFTEDWQYTQGLGDLDQANGRFGVTPEYPDGTYHYVLTEAFPHIPRHFAGTPDNSFRKRGGGDRPNRGERGERGQRPPRGERPR
ncbi:MAG: YHYH protein, partial [Planctomycetota bacterium]